MESFPGLAAVVESRQTILSGQIESADELHALLEQLGAFGLELIEVRRVDLTRRR